MFTQATSNATALTLTAAASSSLTNAIAPLLVPVTTNPNAGQFGFMAPAPTIVPTLAAAPALATTPAESVTPPSAPTSTFSVGRNGTLQIQNFGVNLPDMVIGLQ